MGMFDTVHYTCPHCGGAIAVQTKDGPCELHHYGADVSGTNLPPDLMISLAASHAAEDTSPEDQIEGVHYPGPITCTECGKRFALKLVHRPAAIVVPVD